MPSVVTNSVTVSTTPTLLCDGKSTRRNLTLTNKGGVSVFLGGSGVTSTAFFRELVAGEVMEFTRGPELDDPAPSGKWYGITASSTAAVSVGEINA